MKLLSYRKDMSVKHVSLFAPFCLFILILSVFSYLSYRVGYQQGKVAQIASLPLEKRIEILRASDTFSVEKLKAYISELNIRYPDIVFAQAQHETGNFKSQIFRENNNLFGMKQATIRPTTNEGQQFGHAYYSTWRQSVEDYALWQAYTAKGLSKEEYLQFLNGYAEDKNYVSILKTKL